MHRLVIYLLPKRPAQTPGFLQRALQILINHFRSGDKFVPQPLDFALIVNVRFFNARRVHLPRLAQRRGNLARASFFRPGSAPENTRPTPPPPIQSPHPLRRNATMNQWQNVAAPTESRTTAASHTGKNRNSQGIGCRRNRVKSSVVLFNNPCSSTINLLADKFTSAVSRARFNSPVNFQYPRNELCVRFSSDSKAPNSAARLPLKSWKCVAVAVSAASRLRSASISILWSSYLRKPVRVSMRSAVSSLLDARARLIFAFNRENLPSAASFSAWNAASASPVCAAVCRASSTAACSLRWRSFPYLMRNSRSSFSSRAAKSLTTAFRFSTNSTDLCTPE